MGTHREKLERRQNLLGRLMDIGTELFAMSATCSYAMAIKADQPEAVELADNWCSHARLKIEKLFDDLHNNHDNMDNKLAGDVLEGKYKWMEKDIVPIGDEPQL
jgi:hypothetical protein